MKKLLLVLALFSACALPGTVKADIAPDPDWLPQEETQDAQIPDAAPEDATDDAVPVLYDDTEEDAHEDEYVDYNDISEQGGSIPDYPDSQWTAFAVVLYITIIVEVIAAAIALTLMRGSLHAVVAVPIASLVTLPIFWSAAIAGAAGGAITEANWPIALLLGEIFIIFVEAIILHVIHPTAITKRQALIVSAIMNVASVLVGFAIGMSG